MTHDVIVIGAGAVGLAIARGLARERSVLLLERGSPGREASWAAAGMLCPHSEAAGDGAFMRLCTEALGTYRAFTLELLDETGIDAEYLDDGTLVVASTPDQRAALERQFAWQHRAGMDTELLDAEEIRRLEPHLSLELEGGIFCPTDHQVRPRLLLEALRKSCLLRGVSLREGVRVEALAIEAGRVRGVRAAGELFEAPVVVVAAGAWASGIAGLRPEIETRPRKGQILSLTMPERRFRHVVRWGRLYLVPRADGELVVGATNEDCGFDRTLTAGGVAGLLRDAERLASSTSEFPLRETWTGLRPMVGDELPVIGPAAIAGLHYAFGHYRNGILLAPVTAAILEAVILDGKPSTWADAFSPMRFANRSHAGSASP